MPPRRRLAPVVATKSGPGDARIYVDGAQSTVQVSEQVVLNTAFPLLFGSAASTRASFDEFALYDNALSPGQVYDHFRRGVAAPRREVRRAGRRYARRSRRSRRAVRRRISSARSASRGRCTSSSLIASGS